MEGRTSAILAAHEASLRRALVWGPEKVGDLGERAERLAVLGQLADPARQRDDGGSGDVQREEQRGGANGGLARDRRSEQKCDRGVTDERGTCSDSSVAEVSRRRLHPGTRGEKQRQLLVPDAPS